MLFCQIESHLLHLIVSHNVMYFFVWQYHRMIAKPVNCHIDSCNYLSHIISIIVIR